MGSHASQLTSEERWKIIRYVQTLQNPGGATSAAPASSDSTKKAMAPVKMPADSTKKETTDKKS